MKKFTTMLIIVMSIFTLAFPASAFDSDYDHQHEWSVINWSDETEMCCTCGTTVVAPHDSIWCLHEMYEFTTRRYHGTECECGFTIYAPHTFEECDGDYEYHDVVCVECGYEDWHDLIAYQDGNHLSLYCELCETISHHRLTVEYQNPVCHRLEVEWLDYVSYEAHELNADGICVECELYTGIIEGFDSAFDEETEEYSFYFHIMVDGETWKVATTDFIGYTNDVVTFVGDNRANAIYEVVDCYSPDTDESITFGEANVDWWRNGRGLLIYDVNSKEEINQVTRYDQVIIVEPENPTQDIICLVVG